MESSRRIDEYLSLIAANRVIKCSPWISAVSWIVLAANVRVVEVP